MTITTHDADFYTWTQEQATLLRQGRLTELDVANLIDEVEDMGRSERREIENRLAVLLMHLLKWCYQPKRRSKSWSFTIKTQRQDVLDVLADNPGLKPYLNNTLVRSYRKAIMQAVKETRLSPDIFPQECPWSLEQVFDNDFWPEVLL